MAVETAFSSLWLLLSRVRMGSYRCATHSTALRVSRHVCFRFAHVSDDGRHCEHRNRHPRSADDFCDYHGELHRSLFLKYLFAMTPHLRAERRFPWSIVLRIRAFGVLDGPGRLPMHCADRCLDYVLRSHTHHDHRRTLRTVAVTGRYL